MTALTHLQRLEAESIDILREAVAESEKPVMLYSIGKDSSVMLHLALKAFHPSKPPFHAAKVAGERVSGTQRQAIAPPRKGRPH